MKLHWQILIALGLGVLVGTLTRHFAGDGVQESWFMDLYTFLGKTVFIGLLKMIIVPLIFSSVVTGIAGLGNAEGFGRLGAKTLGYYLMTTAIAVAIGLGVVNLIKPGLSGGQPNAQIAKFIEDNREDFEAKGAEFQSSAETVEVSDTDMGFFERIWVVGRDLVERMIPNNIMAAASNNGEMLALIFVSLLVAFGLIATSGEGRDTLVSLIKGLNDLMIKITGWIMLLAPIGVFGLMAMTIAQTGPTFLISMLKFALTVLLALGLHLFVALPLILIVLGKVSPRRHFRAMRDALLTSFSTASSSATLPVTMRCLQDRAGVSKRTSSFVLPLGATVNMDGTALYECVAVIFIAQVTGFQMDLTAQIAVVILALLTSVGVAGVPSASLVAIVIILENVNLPGGLAAIGAIYAVDRILDMCRTSVNIFSDSCGAVIIAKSEGEEGVLTGDGAAVVSDQ